MNKNRRATTLSEKQRVEQDGTEGSEPMSSLAFPLRVVAASPGFRERGTRPVWGICVMARSSAFLDWWIPFLTRRLGP